MSERKLLTLDFGGTKLSAAMATADGRVWLAKRRLFTPADADGVYEYEAMLGLAWELISGVGSAVAIGVSFGGPVDARAGIVRLSHHVPGWEDFRLRDRLQQAFALPVAIDNDATVGALGEFTFGAGQGCHSLLYVTVSTGIGGGWIINDEPYQGYHGMAGEIGHMVVTPGGMPCACGKRGCLEAEACGPAIAKRARQAIETDPKAGQILLAALDMAAPDLTAADLSQAAEAGNTLAQKILREAGYVLGRGLAGAISLMDPQRVVLGGGVTKAGQLWWQAVREAAQAYTLPEVPVDIVAAELGDDAPLWGGVALARGLLQQD